MLVLMGALNSKPVASVQSGHRVAISGDMIIDPRNLKVFAFRVNTPQGQNLVLHTEDIRSVTPQGMIIDNNDQLMDQDEDLIRLNEVLKINFKLIGKTVYTESKKKLGKVSDFVTETDDFMIMKLHIARSMMKSLGTSQLIIDRSQIVQVTDDRIVVHDASIKEKSGALKKVHLGKPLSLSAEPIKSKSQQ